LIGEIFYTLFIWPVNFLLEFLFVLFIRIFNAPGPAIIFLSIVVNTLILPIYLVADRWQREERELQKKMKKRLDKIRSLFRGEEKQLIINTYYRQMGYSPVFILRASVGLLLQIPFFIAAYQFLSRTKLLTGVSFLFINDLNVPDALLPLPFSVFGFTALNLMPVLMTIINIFSSLIYAKDFGKREKIQLFAMALVFLVLLYNSPSGLVLYWTMNNIYSLAKNTAQAYLKKPAKVLQIGAIIAALTFIYLILSGTARVERYGLFFGAFAFILAASPFIWKLLAGRKRKISENIINSTEANRETSSLYFSSVVLLFLLLGILNPVQVLSSSISDFINPRPFLYRTVLQGVSLLVLIPLFIRILSSNQIRKGLSIIWSSVTMIGLLCYFTLSANYGMLDRNFKFDDTDRLLYAFPVSISVLVPLLGIAFILIFILTKKIKVLVILLKAASAAIVLLICIDLVVLGKGYAELKRLIGSDDYQGEEMPVYFRLSKKENNVFIIVLDRAQGSAMIDALEYMPSLHKELDGFIFYPNTLSFGANTVLGVPAMLGGYNYTPAAINARKDETLVYKVNSALTLMPRVFGEAGYRVTITDPVIANMQSVPDISIFKDLQNVTARLLSGKLSDHYHKEFPVNEENQLRSFDFDILFRYGIFRASPPALRYGIYYKGQWWREAAYNSYGRAVGEFSSLYYLGDICSPDSSYPTLNILMNSITHEEGSYNRSFFPQEDPVEFSREEIRKYGSVDNAEYIHMLFSAFRQLVKWFDFLKSEGIYDNTRIIIVSDHGGFYTSNLDRAGMGRYNPLLMIKDFESSGELEVSEVFMTHSDTPYLAAEGINNISEKIDGSEVKEKGEMTAFRAISFQPLRHGPNLFNLTAKRELKGREVLKKESWGDWERY